MYYDFADCAFALLKIRSSKFERTLKRKVEVGEIGIGIGIGMEIAGPIMCEDKTGME